MLETPATVADLKPVLAAPATLDDVAKMAKVSPITVSRVINRPELVSEKTQKKVRNAIRKTGYVPNMLAGALVSQRSRLVIVVVPNVANRAFVDTIPNSASVWPRRATNCCSASQTWQTEVKRN